MVAAYMRPCGDFRQSYRADTTIFDDKFSLWSTVAILVVIGFSPFYLDAYGLNLLIQICYLGIAALGLNILVGFTGQISVGHAVFFGFGAFASAWLNSSMGVPVFFAIPLAGLMTACVGLIFGIPAARIKGLYLAIATLAAQFIMQDFFARASWFTGGVAGALTNPMVIWWPFAESGWLELFGEHSYFYVAFLYAIVMYLFAANLMRSRDGRALVAVRDHYLAAEIMGLNLSYYRILSFGISSFYAGIGGAIFAHYLGFVSIEEFTILFSIEFLAMIIIGGLGSIMGSLLGAGFMVLLPEVMNASARALSGSWIDQLLGLNDAINFLKNMAIGAVIILFLIFEPNGLAHRWQLIKAYFRLFPYSH